MLKSCNIRSYNYYLFRNVYEPTIYLIRADRSLEFKETFIWYERSFNLWVDYLDFPYLHFQDKLSLTLQKDLYLNVKPRSQAEIYNTTLLLEEIPQSICKIYDSDYHKHIVNWENDWRLK